MNFTHSLGSWIRTRRRALDLTQQALADLAFCSTDTIKKIESDQRRPSRPLAQSLARALGLPAGQQDLFVDCARGLRPVGMLDSLPTGSAADATAPVIAPPTNLPSPLTALVDRTQVIADLSQMLFHDDFRLISLIGPPGVGKTRLSIHCGELARPRFPGGVWFVDLSVVTDPALVLPAVAAALDVPLTSGPPAERIAQALRRSRLLLVLDNLEHLVAGAALDVVELLQRIRGLKVLATSRVRLNVYGEHEYQVPPLSLPPRQMVHQPEAILAFESVQLLVARIRQHQPMFQVTGDNAAAVAELCWRLDGIPLAMELAAARTRQVPVGELVQALGDPAGGEKLLALGATSRDRPSRQRTLVEAIAWSYRLLQPAEQAVLCRLGVFVGSFDTEAAAAVCAPLGGSTTADVATVLAVLADYSLLARERRKESLHWRLLEMIREFALAQLSPEELTAARQRHADHFRNRFRDVAAGRSLESFLSTIEPHHDNLRAALDWAIANQDGPLALELCEALAWYWELRGFHHEGLPRVRQVLALPESGDPRLRVSVLQTVSNLEWQRQAFPSALEFAGQAAELVRRHHLDDELLNLLQLQGRICIEQGELQRAWEVLRESAELARRRPELHNPGRPLAQLGEVAWATGRPAEAKALFEEALRFLANEGSDLFSAMAWTDVAEIALSEGDFAAALHALRQAFPHATDHIRRFRSLLVAAAGWLLNHPLSTGGDACLAACLLAAEAGLAERVGGPLAPFQQLLIQARMELLQSRLAESEREYAWPEGRTWDLARAIAETQALLTG